MKRKNIAFYLLAALLLTSTAASAQESQPVKRFEFEAKPGGTCPIDRFVGLEQSGTQLGLESRWNMDTPFDVALELYMGSAVRHYNHHDISTRIFSLSVYGDYNFRRGSKVAPFVGAGIGSANCENIQGSEGREGGSLLLVPRVGVELWNHLRLTADLRLARKGFNTIGLSIGYAFGGGRKHQ